MKKIKKTKKTKIANTKKTKRVTKRVEKRAEAKHSPEADQWLTQALAEFSAKQDILKSDWGFGSFESWAFDQPTKTFVLRFADGTQFEGDGQILGTYCPGDASWEWAWNNPNIDAAVAVPGDALKDLGSRLGISYLTSGIVPAPNRELANYLCAIGVKATGALGVYLGGEGPVEAAIVLSNPRRKLKAA